MRETLRRFLRSTSWPVPAAMLALMAFGILAIGVSERAESVSAGHMTRQIVFACIGVLVFVGAAVVPYQRVGRLAYVLFGVTLGLLVVVLAPPPLGRLLGPILPVIRGSRRWIDLKVFMVQPSELAKLTYVILLAWYLRSGDHCRRLSGLIVPFVLTFLPMALILKEPDLGTSLLLPPTLYLMLYMAGAKLRHLLGIVAVGTALLFLPVPRRVPTIGPGMKLERKWDLQREIKTRRALAYGSVHRGGAEYLVSAAPLALLKFHQVERIDGWLRQSDERIALTKGYQLHQSKMILGGGRWTGRSGWNDADAYFQVLPDDHTDFIFSVIGGQWGFLGCVSLLLLYGIIFLFGIEIAASTYDAFGRLLAVGVLALLFSQIVINVGMTMGLMPITGMTLPLISYGGSSLLVNCAAIGLLVNVALRRPILLSRRPFEYGQKKEKPPAPYGPHVGAEAQPSQPPALRRDGRDSSAATPQPEPCTPPPGTNSRPPSSSGGETRRTPPR